MVYDHSGDRVSYLAAVDLTPFQCRAVALALVPPDARTQGICVCPPGLPCIGILEDKPALGQPGSVKTTGKCEAVLEPATSLASVSLMEVGTSGALRLHTTSSIVAKYLGPSLNAVPYEAVILVQLWSAGTSI